MKSSSQALIVIAGYVAAVVVAFVVVIVYVAATDGPERKDSAGMSLFAPIRSCRIAFVSAAAIEIVVFVSVALIFA